MNALPNTMPTSQGEKERLLSLLRESREKFLGSFADVTEEQGGRRPTETSWSVLDTVEHLTAAEKLMVRLLSATRRPRKADAANREAIFLERMGSRSRKVETPESGRPKGRFANLAEARVAFGAVRESTMRFVEETGEDFRATEVTHPHPAVGDVSTYEMIIIIAKHAERHALQIEEIKTSPAFCGGQG